MFFQLNIDTDEFTSDYLASSLASTPNAVHPPYLSTGGVSSKFNTPYLNRKKPDDLAHHEFPGWYIYWWFCI